MGFFFWEIPIGFSKGIDGIISEDWRNHARFFKRFLGSFFERNSEGVSCGCGNFNMNLGALGENFQWNLWMNFWNNSWRNFWTNLWRNFSSNLEKKISNILWTVSEEIFEQTVRIISLNNATNSCKHFWSNSCKICLKSFMKSCWNNP